MEGPMGADARRWAGRGAVLLLAVCQGLAVTGQVIMVTWTGLVGYTLATNKALATVPVALQLTGMMLAIVPASLFMKRVGRRTGFMVGAGIGLVGATIAATAVLHHRFVWYIAGSIIYGLSVGFNHFYRHAAADTAPEAYRSRAISWVLGGGLMAAVVGPALARWSSEKIPDHTFAASFVIIALLQIATLAVLVFLRLPAPTQEERRQRGRPLGAIMRQKGFVVAALTATVGYAVMAFVMTATPLAVVGHHHSFPDAAFVIQWHVIGMFAPSFFAGHLIHRYGAPNVMAVGALASLGTVAINLSGTGIWHFWGALILLGVGWNFMFVSGTSMLAGVHTAAERAKTQAANDVIVFGAVALASFLAGAVYHRIGWDAVNLSVVPPLVTVLAATLWLRRSPLANTPPLAPKTSSPTPASAAPEQT